MPGIISGVHAGGGPHASTEQVLRSAREALAGDSHQHGLSIHPPGILWNPASLSYLAEVLLASTLAGFLIYRILRGRRSEPLTTHLMAMVFLGLLVALVASLLRVQSGGGWTTYAMPWDPPGGAMVLLMPWVSVGGACAIWAYCHFCYRFPATLPVTRLERNLVTVMLSGALGAEVMLALRADLASIHDQTGYRPDYVTAWMMIAILWSAVVTLRQMRHARLLAHKPAGPLALMLALAGRDLSRPEAAARAYLLLLLLPIFHTLTLLLQNHGIIGQVSMDVLSCWTTLALLAGLCILYFNHQPERSSLLFKIATVSLGMTLAVISALGWAISGPYAESFSDGAMVAGLRTLGFTPTDDGGYHADWQVFAPEPVSALRLSKQVGHVDLPFAFTFFGHSYRSIHVSDKGAIGFSHVPTEDEQTIAYGPQPAIEALGLELAPPGPPPSNSSEADRPGWMQVATWPDHVAISWIDMQAKGHPEQRYSFQVVLEAGGQFRFNYLAVPRSNPYSLFEPERSARLVGVTPGKAHAIVWLDLQHGLPAHIPPGTALMQDYYLDFLLYLDHLYNTLAGLMLLAWAGLLLGLFLFFRANLLLPLNRLLGGVRRFHEGDLGVQVAVTYQDEIGSLTASFNDMARTQQMLVANLADKVAERVDEVSQIAARNALLEERARLSGELHDAVSQTLFSANLLADGLPARWQSDPDAGHDILRQIGRLNRLALEEIRQLITGLHTSDLSDRPLADLLSDLVAERAGDFPIPIHAEISGPLRLPANVQVAFYRIAQEALTNIGRHARAHQTGLTFEAIGQQAMLRITDDGQGFDPRLIRAGHLGLQIMQYRARRAGISLDIQSQPGRGSTITLIWFEDDNDE